MKKALLTTAFLIVSIIGFGQCPTGDIQLFSQSQIDSFAADYPNCSQLNVNITIIDPAITNLNGLSAIESSSATIEISNTSIINFQGLNNLESVNELLIISNQNLQSFEGLNQLQEVEKQLRIFSNTMVENFMGFDSLSSIGYLYLQASSIQNFDGISSNLLTIGAPGIPVSGLTIFSNQNLSSLSGLENVISIEGSLNITQSNLTNYEGLSSLVAVNGTFGANNNLALLNFTGLDSLEYVEGLDIDGNFQLLSLSGLESLESFDGFLNLSANTALTNLQPLQNLETTNYNMLTIENNIALSTCDVTLICNFLQSSTAQISIENNAPGCNSIAEVEIECGIVDIPDANFLNALLDYTPVIDTNNDDLIQFDEAEAFTGNLDISNKTIFNFTGLEAFVNITGFNGSENFMDGLSLKDNTLLTSVDFSDCPDLEAVNLKNGNNTAITTFNGVNCPSLEFVCVDDVAFAEANFTNIDAQVQFVDDCAFLSAPSFNLEEAIVVFPNPVSENLTISVIENFSYVKAEVFSVTGQKLKETMANQINMTDFTAGIYFVKVISEEGSITKKIVKQ